VLDVAVLFNINVARLTTQLLSIHDRVIAETTKQHKHHADLLASYASAVDVVVDQVEINGQGPYNNIFLLFY